MAQINRIVGSLLLMFTAAVAVAASYEWPQWQGPTRDGLTNETGLLQEWPEGGPKQLWVYKNCGVGYSGPAIVDGRLYTLGARDGNSFLIAIDANTGNEIWATPIGPDFEESHGDGPRATPTIDHGMVYAMNGMGTLVCAQASDGKEVWRVTMESLGGKMPKWGYCESVLIDGDVLLCTPGGAQGAIAALEKSTGKVRWQTKDIPDDANYSSIIRATINGQPQYVQLLVTRVVGIAPDDGRLLWQAEWGGRVAVIPTPIVQGDLVFITSGYGAGCKLVHIGADNNATDVYANKTMKNHHGGVILLDGKLYGHSDGVGWVCMEFATGDKVWADKESLSKGAIAYADGRFYCLSEDKGEVVLIEASPDGWKEHGRFTLDPQSQLRKKDGRFWTHPVVVDGKLYLRDQDLVYCYDVKQ